MQIADLDTQATCLDQEIIMRPYPTLLSIDSN